MQKIFFRKQDFFTLKNEYEKNYNTKEKLLKWMDQYQEDFYPELNDVELNDTELTQVIQRKRDTIERLENELSGLSRQIELQKKQNDHMDIIIQEIFSLAEQYSKLDEHAMNCPVCGTKFASGEKLRNVIRVQKQFVELDDTFLQVLLKQKTEKERCLEEFQSTQPKARQISGEKLRNSTDVD